MLWLWNGVQKGRGRPLSTLLSVTDFVVIDLDFLPRLLTPTLRRSSLKPVRFKFGFFFRTGVKCIKVVTTVVCIRTSTSQSLHFVAFKTKWHVQTGSRSTSYQSVTLGVRVFCRLFLYYLYSLVRLIQRDVRPLVSLVTTLRVYYFPTQLGWEDLDGIQTTE